MTRVTLKVRRNGKVERHAFDSLDTALAEIESRGRALQRTTRSAPVDTKVLGRFEPAQLVEWRLELSRPAGGVDVHGDGSATAFVGRVRRRALEGDDPYVALRQAVTGSA